MGTKITVTLFLRIHFAIHTLRYALLGSTLSMQLSMLQTLVYIIYSPQECHNDTHPDAPTLRKQRIRAYSSKIDDNTDICLTGGVYRLQCYLIIDNVGEEDGGEYTLNVTTKYNRVHTFTASRSVNTSISMCLPTILHRYNVSDHAYMHIHVILHKDNSQNTIAFIQP